MRKITFLTILLLLVAFGQAGPAAAITGGELDGDGHPNVGMMAAYIDGERVWRCSGTLVAPRVFLTAGHCVGDGADFARVWFDSDLSDPQIYETDGFTGTPIPHPEYFWGAADPHDVGVVILDEAVEIEPATLPSPDMLTELKKDRVLEGGSALGVMFRSVGYGGTLESWPPPELAYDRIRRVSESEFASLTKTHLHLFQREVFDESGSCFGDSGGPVFYVEMDSETIAAVTSSGDAQCIATGRNYRVDVPDILQWILDQYPE